MKNRAIWVALAVIAAAAVLMFFVVLPQIRGDKTAEELARKAAESVQTAAEQAKATAQKAAETAQQAASEKLGDAAADLTSGALDKMARLKAETSAATAELQALLAEGKTATPEQIGAAKAKLIAALKNAATELKAPEGLDAAAGAVLTKAQQGAAKALAAVEAMPTDMEGAKKAFEALKSTLAESFLDAANDATVPKTAADAAADAKPADVATPTLPAFDVLRVEPDGSTVIAGSAAPGTKLDIVDAGKVIASTEVGPTGDFAAVLDNPLSAGDHQITLEATGKDGKSQVSEEIATVSVPKDNKGELLAMVTKPGEASRIMAMPEAKTADVKSTEDKTPAVDTKTELAAADAKPAADTKAVTPDNATSTDAKPAVAGETQIAEVKPADAQPAVDAAKAAAANADAAKTTIQTPDLPAASSDLVATAPAVDVTKTPDGATSSSDAASPLPDAKDSDTTSKAAPEVQVSAVEIEGSKLFVAGTAKPNSVIRVYADDKLVAEVATDKNGRFVADNTMPLAVGDHTIRADVLSADGAKVEFRASVPFFRPEGEQLAAVAGDPSAKKSEMTPLADGAYDKAREEAGKAVGLLKNLYKDGKSPTAEELAAARSSTEFALKTLSEIRVPAEADQMAKDMAAKTSGEAAKALALLNALPQDAGAVKQALASIDQAVTSATAPSMKMQVDAEKPIPQTAGSSTETGDAAQQSENAAAKTTPEAAKVATADSEAAAQVDVQASSSASATDPSANAVASADTPKVIEQAPLTPSETSVIIRRGDTLWQISRRVYGRGVRYTTIYLANEKQIADPDRILPGQIFGVPDQPLPNAEELHRKRLGLK